jgi:hypothetical protein
MWGIVLMVIAALFVAASNLCMRRGLDGGGSSKAYLVIQLLLIFLVAILLNPVRTGQYEWSSSMAIFGLMGGLILVGMLISLGRALEVGPPALTFAALNSSAVMPAILLVALFGSPFGCLYTFWNGAGSILVILGLFWAGSGMSTQLEKKKVWITCVVAAFSLHVLFLVLMRWKALFLSFPSHPDLYLPFNLNDAKSQWFMPMVFLAAVLFQTALFFFTEKRKPTRQETKWGFFGGLFNGVGTFFLIRAAEVASPFEAAMIFPVFAITTILFCNIWGQWLYKEAVNWKACSLCIGGLLVGTVDWAVF